MASSARIDELLKKFDENPRRYFAPLANEYRKAGDVQRAIELCREHLPQQPGHMSGHIVYGQALFEARDFDEARRVFEAALALDPENLIALRHLGDIARDHGDVAAARDWYQRVLDADPRNEEIAAQIASLGDVGAAGVGAAAGHGGNDAADTAPMPELLDSALVPSAAASGASSATSPPAETRSDESDSGLLDFDAMEGTAAGGGAPATPLGLERLESAPNAAAMSEMPTEEMAAPSFPGASMADDSAFGEIDLGDEGTGGTRRSSSRELDEAMDTGLAPTPASGSASMASSTRDDSELLDFGGLEEPLAQAAAPEAPSVSPSASASPADDAAQVVAGRLPGLESMEFIPPAASEADSAEADPTLGHTLREDAGGAAATPAAFVTETMAELYLQQGFRDEALAVYRQLLAQSPGDANLRDRVAQLEAGSVSTVSAAAVSSSVIEAAQQRSAARPTRSVRSFFASLAARRAPQSDRASPTAGDDDSPAGVAAAASGSGIDAESTAADAYVEASGEGYDEAAADEGGATERRAGGVGTPPAAFDEFGFPVIDEDEAPSESVAADASRDVSEERPEAAELPESAAIEPATLDYLAHEQNAGDEAHVGHEGERTSAAPEGSSPTAAGEAGPVDSLFEGASVSRQDEAAAAALAGAFAPERPATPSAIDTGASGAAAKPPTAATSGRSLTPPPAGPPTRQTPAPRDARTPATRPAARELSLDDVFRETPRRSGSVRREAGAGFSFDQFFADGSSSAGPKGSGATPTRGDAAGGASSAGAASTDADAGGTGEGDPTTADIEQFNAWLEGLKKK